MKFELIIAAFILALPAHAAVFKSSATSGPAEANVLVFFVPGKTPQVINPESGETATLPATNPAHTKDADSPPAN